MDLEGDDDLEYRFCKIWLEWLLAMLTNCNIVEWKVYASLGGDIQNKLLDYIKYRNIVLDYRQMAASFSEQGYVDDFTLKDKLEPLLKQLMYKVDEIRDGIPDNALDSPANDPQTSVDHTAAEGQSETDPPSDSSPRKWTTTLDQDSACNSPSAINPPITSCESNRKRRAVDRNDGNGQAPLSDCLSSVTNPSCSSNSIWTPSPLWPNSEDDLLADANEFVSRLQQNKFVVVDFSNPPKAEKRAYNQQDGPSTVPNTARKNSAYGNCISIVYNIYQDLQREKNIYEAELCSMDTAVESLPDGWLKTTLQDMKTAVKNFVEKSVPNGRIVDKTSTTKNRRLIAKDDLPKEIKAYQCLIVVLKQSRKLAERAKNTGLTLQNINCRDAEPTAEEDTAVRPAEDNIGNMNAPVDEYARNTNSIYPREETSQTFQVVNRNEPNDVNLLPSLLSAVLQDRNAEPHSLEEDVEADYMDVAISNPLASQEQNVDSEDRNKGPMFCQFSPSHNSSPERCLSYEPPAYFDPFESLLERTVYLGILSKKVCHKGALPNADDEHTAVWEARPSKQKPAPWRSEAVTASSDPARPIISTPRSALLMKITFLLISLLVAVSGLTLWSNNTVPFYCDRAFSYDECLKIRIAAQEIQAHTCLDFKEKPFGNQPNWIHIFKGLGCYSYVGMQSWITFLSLGDGCHDKNTIIHEFFHALGVQHMHQRQDRDEHLTINWNRIPFGFASQFARHLHPFDTSLPYDYSSNMHYDTFKGVMMPKDEEYSQFLGNARGASFYDYHTINKLYRCYEKCPWESFLKCKNGGVPNPRDCSKCNCPSGYIGNFCDKKPPTVDASTAWQKVKMTSPSLPHHSFNKMENVLWIEAPFSKQVDVRIIRMGMYSSQEYHGECQYYGLEIKTQWDNGLGGPVVCNQLMTDRWHIYRSHWNILPLIAYNGLEGQQYYEVEYRYV